MYLTGHYGLRGKCYTCGCRSIVNVEKPHQAVAGVRTQREQFGYTPGGPEP
jgi:hypothetical protein